MHRFRSGHWPLGLVAVLLAGLAVLATRGGLANGEDQQAAVSVTYDIPYKGKGGPTLQVYEPQNTTRPAPAVIAVHGGTWRHGDGGKMHKTAKQVAAHGFVVFKVGYRYASKEKKRGAWPGQLNDVKDGVRWVRANADRYGVDPTRIAALGSSSGAHIVALLATLNRGELTEGARVKAAVTWSAFIDLPKLRKNQYFPGIRIFVGCEEKGVNCRKRLRRASPIRHVSKDDPAMLLVNGKKEFVPKRQPKRMARKLRRKGVEARTEFIGGDLHGQRMRDQTMPRTIRFLRKQVGPTAAPVE